MPPLPEPRTGETLVVKERQLPFSFFPLQRGTRRWGLGDALFAASPWAVIRGAVHDRIQSALRPEAMAFVEQAEDFYSAATDRVSANPLLLYYAFLNLTKAFFRTAGLTASLDRAMHGLTERTPSGGSEFVDSEVVVKDGGPNVNVFAQLVESLGFDRPADGTAYRVSELLPQVVVGHRLWREAESGRERFVSIQEIELVDARDTRQLWLCLYLDRGDLARYEIRRKDLLDNGGLGPEFREVKIGPTGRDPSLACLEQVNPLTYTSRPSDVVMELVQMMRPRLWRIVSSVPGSGYRRYYVHITPTEETARVPQLASMWLLFYYFGSVVRYRPHVFDEIAAGPFGAFVTEFVSAQAEQFLYLLASEMCAREVAKPAIA